MWLGVFGVAGAIAASGCGSSAHAGSGASSAHMQQVVSYTLRSKDTHGVRHETAVVTGSSGHGRGLLILLPGRSGTGGATHSFAGSSTKVPLAALADRAPVIVGVDGGGSSYFHDRASGDWGSYVVDEVIPDAIRRFHTDPQRIAIGGDSMGGFGALDIARLHRSRFCAVGVREPAILRSGGESAAGSFDSATDFARHDLIASVVANPNLYGSIPLWIDHGDYDAFVPGDNVFIAALRRGRTPLTVHVWPGEHGGGYTSRHEDTYLNFMANALEHCHGK